MKDILVATLGQTPRTVTETAGELVRRGTALSDIVMIRTRGSRTVPQGVRARLLPSGCWREVEIDAPDVLTPEDARAMARTLFDTVAAEKARAGEGRLLLDLTGGRKTMSAYALLAAQFLLDEEDRVYHAEADRTLFTGDKWFPETDGEVQLLEVPFVGMQPPLTAMMQAFSDAARFDPFASTAAAVRHLRRHAVLGLMARGVEHEVHSDLNVLLGHLEELRDGGDAHTLIEAIRRRAESVDGVMRSMLAMVEAPARLGRERAALRPIVEEAVEEARERYDADFRLKGDDAPVRLDPLLLRRVLRILCQNAVQARAGTVRLTLRRTGGGVRLDIRDDGEGMSERVRAEAFHPVKRTQPAGERRGVGLIVARRIVEGYGGTLTLESTPGRGTCVTITLPAEEDA